MKQRIGACMLAIILLAVMPAEVLANNLTTAQQKQKDLQQQLKSITSEKKETSEELVANRQLRAEIVKELEEKGYEKQAIEEKLAQIDSAIKTLSVAIEDAETEYDEELALFQERLLMMYQRSKTWQGLDMVLNNDNISEFYKNRNAMKTVSKADQDMMASLIAKREQIEELQEQKRAEEAITKSNLEDRLNAIKDLQVSRAQVDEEIDSTQKTLAQLQKDEDSLNAEANKITALIKQLKTSTVRYVGGEMSWPVPGNHRISSPYGNRLHPIYKVYRFHSGIDIHAGSGAPIAAANSGKIIYAGWRNGYGNTVIMDHGGGVTTLYAHIINRGILVRDGQNVTVGDIIAKVGSTGLSTGPHLHFEVRKNGNTQNPVSFLGTRQ